MFPPPQQIISGVAELANKLMSHTAGALVGGIILSLGTGCPVSSIFLTEIITHPLFLLVLVGWLIFSQIVQHQRVWFSHHCWPQP